MSDSEMSDTETAAPLRDEFGELDNLSVFSQKCFQLLIHRCALVECERCEGEAKLMQQLQMQTPTCA